jgi:hypothetical protein
MGHPRITLASRVTFFDAGRIALGGTPRRLSRLSKPAQELVSRLRLAGTDGVALASETERSVAQVLIDRGLAHPRAATSWPKITTADVEIVIPTRGRVAQVERLLDSLARPNVVVIDDATEPGEQLAASVGAQLLVSLTQAFLVLLLASLLVLLAFLLLIFGVIFDLLLGGCH